MTIFKSEVTSCPKLEGVEWQCSSDGNEFFCIDISTPHYHGSKQLAESPLLVISKTTFEDRLHYRLRVTNKIGRSFSNILYLDVKGSMYQIECFNGWSITVNIISLNTHFITMQTSDFTWCSRKILPRFLLDKK